MLISIISSEKLFFHVNVVFSQTKDYNTMTYSKTEQVTSYFQCFAFVPWCKYYQSLISTTYQRIVIEFPVGKRVSLWPTHPLVGRVAQSVQRLATGWMVRGSNPGEGKIFRTCPDQPWGPPSLLYIGYWVFPGGKEQWLGRDADDPSLPSSTMVKKGQNYASTHSSYGPYSLYRASVPVQGCTLPPFLSKNISRK